MWKVTLLTFMVISFVLSDIAAQLGRQLMLQQLQIEEKARTDGDSGVKTIRLRSQGTKSYHSTHISRNAVFSIHDHSNHINTVGMGELEVILNGVQFRTRHNDYKMTQKSKTSPDYNAVEDVEYPDVPAAVLEKETPEEQIEEMSLWIKAWGDQDHSVRDYRPYFPANLCYLEGAWTHSSGDIEESFDSDRHFLDADTWFQMQENIRFTAYSGGKDSLENFSYLPTKIFDMINGTIPLFAQWNYKILCHRIKQDIPFNRLRIVEDLTSMMARQKDKESLGKGREARYTLNTHDSDRFFDGIKNYGLLDELMNEIPGKDNYQANLSDQYGAKTFVYNDDKTPLNPGYYHRWYSTIVNDAAGRSKRHRAFNDANLFFAMTSQDKIAGMNYKSCSKIGGKKVCTQKSQKWSYAIPLEIIYSTPLYNWNPYNIVYRGRDIAAVKANGRTGNNKLDNPATALNGTCNSLYYMTPAALFSSASNPNSDAADTVKGSLKVLDKDGNVRTMKSSGIRIFINNVRGVSQNIRQRYPIAPLYVEGNTIWKELEALKDVVLNSQKYSFILNEKLSTSSPDGTTTPQMPNKSTTTNAPLASKTMQTSPGVQGHIHLVTIGAADLHALMNRKSVTLSTEERLGHTHTLKLKYIFRKKQFKILRCDNRLNCMDGHSKILQQVNSD